MGRRPTIQQLAAASGVSVATVDRVLNRRLPVRAETASRVYEAAQRIGFHATRLIGKRLREEQPEVRLAVLLLRTSPDFYGSFAEELKRAAAAAADARIDLTIDFMSSEAIDEVVARMEVLAERVHALAVVAPEHPILTAAVERLAARGIAVFSLLSDFAAGVRRGYVGVHNGKVGRTAAWMISRCARRPGKVALFVGSHRFHGHELREIGFRAFLREAAPGFTVLDTVVTHERADLAEEALTALAHRHDDLVGVYNAGGGTEGLIAALRTLPADRRPAAVGNELTPHARAALADNLLNLVVGTPQTAMSRELIGRMLQAARDGEAVAPSQTFLPFDLFLPESV